MAAPSSLSPDPQHSGKDSVEKQSSALQSPSLSSTREMKGAGRGSRKGRDRKPHLPKSNVQLVLDGISLFSHGIHGVLAHLMALIPDNLIKGIVFVAVLVVLVYEEAVRHPGSHELCFGAFCALAVIALGLVAALFRNSGTDNRLRDMQDERLKAIDVKPLYQGDVRT
jgi:hypothetical protein